jgi:hypothetical protein
LVRRPFRYNASRELTHVRWHDAVEEQGNTMKIQISAALFATVIAVSACEPTPQNQAALGAAFGGAAGFALAELVDANPEWTAVAVLGGAAAGAVVAQNQATSECAYADGRGGYYIAAC